MNDKPQTISLEGGGYLSYYKTEGKQPGVVFFGGFMSDMSGTKATALEKFCQQSGRSFIRFDYEGHGLSSGRFEEGTIGKWLGNALKILDELTEGRQIIVGSSMGGWIMLLAALKRPEKIAGLVGIAAAPDFTHELILLDLSDEQRKTMVEIGHIEIPSDYGKNYTITCELIEESSIHLLLSYDEITIEAPVRLIHGMKDNEVPWTTALRICDKLIGTDVQVILDKEGGHQMSGERELTLIEKTLAEMIELCEKQ